MAKTIRRKGVRYHEYWVLRDYDWAISRHGGRYLKKVRIDRHSEKGIKELARYHSDAGFGDYRHCPAPGWYRKCLNTRRKTEELREIRRSLADAAYDHVSPVFIRDAGWYW